MSPQQKRNLAAALRELADRIDADPGHLLGKDVVFEASVPGRAAIDTQKITVSIWFIRAARLARAGALLFASGEPPS